MIEDEIPPDAIRELITNAVMHRSYVNCGASAITVALYDDRLGVSRRTVTNRIRRLKEAGIVRRVGPDKGGYWEV